MEKQKVIKKMPLLLLTIPLYLASPLASASDYGCEALLCFSGGKGLSECQPTVKRVLKDLSKGKGFPHCSFVNANGGAAGSGDGIVSTNVYRERWSSGVCRDGVTSPFRKNKKWYCNTIEVNIKPQYAADKAHQKQFYNY